jgi:hypothetical protein
MELLTVLKEVIYIVWSLVGLTVIGCLLWGLSFYKKTFNKIFNNDITEQIKLFRVK